MKENKLKLNLAGGYDFLTERDGGNTVLILTGSPKYSNQYWRSVKRLADKALKLLKEENKPNEVPDEMPEWEELNNKLIQDNRTLLAALGRMKQIEKDADSYISTGIVDNPHTKGLRAMVLVAERAINAITNEIYND